MIKQNSFYTVRGYHLNEKNNLLTSSMEDYVEMIYRMTLEEEYIRVNQLAEKLNVRPSSTTKIIQKLSRIGVVYYQKYGVIQLTEAGKEVGSFLLNRHFIIENFLKKIGVTDTLLKETEMIEHDISSNTLKKITLLNDFFDHYPEVQTLYEKYQKKILTDQNI